MCGGITVIWFSLSPHITLISPNTWRHISAKIRILSVLSYQIDRFQIQKLCLFLIITIFMTRLTP